MAASRPELGIAWNINARTGWGLLGYNLAVELVRGGLADPIFLCGATLEEPLPAAILSRALAKGDARAGSVQSSPERLDYPVIHALTTDLARTRSGMRWEGKENVAINFLEFTGLTPIAVEASRRYRIIFAGSSWGRDLLSRAGVRNAVVWEQGVDLGRFHPAPAARLFPGRFVIFSGGSLTFRKGQDLVVGAFRAFRRRHPDALLVTAWRSPVKPLFLVAMPRYGAVRSLPPADADGRPDIDAWLLAEGLPRGSFINLPVVHNAAMPEVLRQADVAVFPNRAEGGTNLIAMEAMASGLPCIISSNTGHLDLIAKCPAYPLQHRPHVPPPAFARLKVRDDADQTIETDGWGESDVADIVANLERVYADRSTAASVGAAAAEAIKDWSWPKQVRRLADAVFDRPVRPESMAGADAAPPSPSQVAP